jgi:ADP-ribosyl-[dinitrogen reductase] hydrolase
MSDYRDRYAGCLLGLAVGDAVGTTLEFRPRGTFTPIDDMVGGGPFRLKPGEWTDDTSMALCLADSLLRNSGFDPRDQMQRYCRWEAEGYLSSNGVCFDIGNTVRHALSRFRLCGEAFAGSEDPSTAGNGSLMRLAPVPMYYGGDAKAAVHYSAQSSRTTHGARQCLDGCRYFGGLVWAALHGATKDELLSPDFSPIQGLWNREPLCSEIAAIAAGSFKQKSPPEIRGSGYVVCSLEAALWAFYRSDTYPSGCLLAANLGDDADTAAAVFGQIAGAHYGKAGIPSKWLGQLARGRLIEELAQKLHHSSGL